MNWLGVLIRFRMERVALTGDIRSMFYQIRVHPKDIDTSQFLCGGLPVS